MKKNKKELMMKDKIQTPNNSYLKKVLTYFLKPKKELTIIFIIWIINIIVSIIEPFLTANEYTSIVNIDVLNVIKYTLIIFTVHILSTILSSLSSLLTEKFTKKVEIDIQKDITKELFKLEINLVLIIKLLMAISTVNFES